MIKKRIKIIGRDGMNWSIDKDRENIEFFLKKTGEVTISNSYIFSGTYFFAWYSLMIPRVSLLKIIKKVFGKKIIAVATNDIRFYEEKFKVLKDLVDMWISPNTKISKFFTNNGVKFVQIPFYVSPEIFFPIKKSKEDLSEILEVDYNKIKGKLLIGSFQRDSLGADLLKPKWQKGPELLVDICKHLPKDKFILVLAGPRRHFIVNECHKYGIPYIFVGDENFISKKEDDTDINNLNEEKINFLYNLIDVYLVTSKSEGGPKAIIEAALTKTKIFSTDVGLARDFLSESQIINKNSHQVADNIMASLLHESESKSAILQDVYTKTSRIFNIESYLKLYKDFVKKI
jgi:hypothetical protein